MMTLRANFAAAGLLTMLSTASVTAAPLALDRTAIAPPTGSIMLAHGRHFSCIRGPAGWHFHNRFGARVPCGPQRRPWRRYY